MADDTQHQSPPAEGSNRGHDTNHERANITDTQSGRHPKSDSEHTDDVEKEMETAREHADPSKGDKVADGGDRVSTEGGGNPQE